MTVNSTNRTNNGGFILPNNTMFNLNDPVPTGGYLRSVTVQFHSSKLPSATAKIWIYTLVPILGSYVGCRQYSVLSSQISRTASTQTYLMPNNTISVASGSYIGIGLLDTSAAILTTNSGSVLRVAAANLTTSIINRTSIYFTTNGSMIGIRLSYTLII